MTYKVEIEVPDEVVAEALLDSLETCQRTIDDLKGRELTSIGVENLIHAVKNREALVIAFKCMTHRGNHYMVEDYE